MKNLLTLTFLCLCLSTLAQENIWTKQTKMTEVIAFERQLNPQVKFLSQKVRLSKDYYPLGERHKTVNPIIVQRKATGKLPIYAEYFYTEPDSILRLASYDWEARRYGDLKEILEARKSEKEKLNIYLSEYERIRNELIGTFGKPAKADKKPKTLSDEGVSYLNQNTLWETEELHADLNMIFSDGTQRIRLTLYWKN